ncbi:hypothetical protein VTK73DRAFT_5180 [Phialemonium thermophilum]|uniref:Uncharacterized protein n=1 Tax=Phialemonium thermophilum TaxID=223376 RepID=A0ABR3XXR1_9PEZI
MYLKVITDSKSEDPLFPPIRSSYDSHSSKAFASAYPLLLVNSTRRSISIQRGRCSSRFPIFFLLFSLFFGFSFGFLSPLLHHTITTRLILALNPSTRDESPCTCTHYRINPSLALAEEILPTSHINHLPPALG